MRGTGVSSLSHAMQSSDKGGRLQDQVRHEEAERQ